MNTIDNQGETSGSSENRVRPSGMGKAHRPLRVWPAILLVVAMVCLRYGPGFVEGGLSKFWMLVVFGPLVCSVIILIWWLTASRATGRERLFGVCGILGALVSSFFSHASFDGGSGPVKLRDSVDHGGVCPGPGGKCAKISDAEDGRCSVTRGGGMWILSPFSFRGNEG